MGRSSYAQPVLDCTIDECGRPRYGRQDYCLTHYRKWKRYGDPTAGKRPWARTTLPSCSVEGCEKLVYGRGMCNMHRMRFQNNGTTDPQFLVGVPIEDRLKWSSDVDDNGCWVWRLHIMHRGYGLASRDGKTYRAHRLSYEVFIGPIPEGLTVDHLCHNRACINPEHLEAVRMEENLRRMWVRRKAATT